MHPDSHLVYHTASIRAEYILLVVALACIVSLKCVFFSFLWYTAKNTYNDNVVEFIYPFFSLYISVNVK